MQNVGNVNLENDACKKCGLCYGRKNVVNGKGSLKAKILFVSEWPGSPEDRTGDISDGPIAKELFRMLGKANISQYEVFLTSTVRCIPKAPPPIRIRKPDKGEITACADFLDQEIEAIKPTIIVPMGTLAVKRVLDKVVTINNTRGTEIWSDKYNCKVIPIYHPLVIRRRPEYEGFTIQDLRRIKTSSEYPGLTPRKEGTYKTIGNIKQFDNLIERLNDVKMFSYDIETSSLNFMLGKILCISFSGKERTGVTLPIVRYIPKKEERTKIVRRAITKKNKETGKREKTGEFKETPKVFEVIVDTYEPYWGDKQNYIIEELRKVMMNDAVKIAHNGKFDNKFLLYSLQIQVRRFVDTMLMHHSLNENAEGMHGLKDCAWNYCVDPETECLIKDRGWSTYKNVKPTDEILAFDVTTGKTKWEKLKKVFVNPNYSGPMIKIGQTELDAFVTPDHRWPIEIRYGGKARKQKKIVVKRTYELNSEGSILRSALHDSSVNKKYSDSFVRLAAWYFTEGNRNSKTNISISQSNVKNKSNVLHILKDIKSCGGKKATKGIYKGGNKRRLGFYYNRMLRNDGMVVFGLSGNFVDTFTNCIQTNNKIPTMEFLTSLTDKQLQIFLDICLIGDGDKKKFIFSQYHKQRMDAFSVLAVLAGWSPSINARGTECTLRKKAGRGKSRSYLGRNHKYETIYNGTIWCPVTVSGHWVARRHGKVFITGNTDMGGYDDIITQWFKERRITRDKRNYAHLPPDMLYKYAGMDADVTLRIYKLFCPRMVEEDLARFYNIWYKPVGEILMKAEMRGILLDKEYKPDSESDSTLLEILTKEVADRLADLKQKWGDINYNSDQQLSKLLFDEQKLPVIATTEKGARSVSEAVLVQISGILNEGKIEEEISENPNICQQILNHRKVTNMLSKYVVGLHKRCDINSVIHTNFLLHGTVTGRLSSSNPNLQNIPKVSVERRIKNQFIPRPGYIFLEADYAQAEFRHWANYSQDLDMIRDIKAADDKTGPDIHIKTASEAWGIPLDKVTTDQRNSAKRVVFGIMYGRQAESVAEQLGITVEEAQTIINQFLARYPIAADWLKAAVSETKKYKQIRSIFGRLRRLPGIVSPIDYIREESERFAMNSPIQSAASDMNCMAAARIVQRIEREGRDGYLLNLVHDSTLFEVKIEQLKDFVTIITEEMEKPLPGVTVPMKVELNTGDRWGEMKEYVLEKVAA